MILKIIFYTFLALAAVFLQIYAIPIFFSYGLLVIVWSSSESREIYILLIMALVLDFLSSFFFGFWFLILILVFLSCQLIYKYLLREWSILVFGIIFFVWQTIYTFLYLLLSGTKFSYWLITDVFLSLLFAIIFFVAFDFFKNWFLKKEILTPLKNKE